MRTESWAGFRYGLQPSASPFPLAMTLREKSVMGAPGILCGPAKFRAGPHKPDASVLHYVFREDAVKPQFLRGRVIRTKQAPFPMNSLSSNTD